MLNEAVYALYEGVGSVEAIDSIMTLGMNHPMGPLKLADLIGLDTCLSIMDVLHKGFGDSKYRPCPPAEEICGCRVSREKDRKRILRLQQSVKGR